MCQIKGCWSLLRKILAPEQILLFTQIEKKKTNIILVENHLESNKNENYNCI